MGFMKFLGNELQSALHDKFIYQKVEGAKVHIMSILHSHLLHRNQYKKLIPTRRIIHYPNDCGEVIDILHPIDS